MIKAIVCAAVVVAAWAGISQAGANIEAKGVVHVLPHDVRTCAQNFPVIDGCEDIITTELGTSIDAFPVFFDLIEFQGMDYALFWSGSESCVFSSCSDGVAGDVVWPNDGVSHTWESCQSGPVAIPGWIWIDTHDTDWIFLVSHPISGRVLVHDCHGGYDGVCCPYMSAVGGDFIGDDPCAPVDPSASGSDTWSELKSLFR